MIFYSKISIIIKH